MSHRITLIPGDGIGPEVTRAAVRILDASGVKISWEEFAAGSEAYQKYQEYIPKELIESIERTGVALKGPVTTPIGGGFPSINVALRKKFDLFANFRPIRNLPSLPTRYPAVDLAIKTIESVSKDAGKLKLFCNLNKILQESGDKDDPGIQKQIDDLVTQLGPDFSSAWDIGDELDENSPDGQEFYAAVDTLAEKCTK